MKRLTAGLAALGLLTALPGPAAAYPRPGRTERVSVAADGTEADRRSERPSVSADGRYVAFQSFATSLVPGDSNGMFDVFVHDPETGTTERVSEASDGTEGDVDSKWPSISADGRLDLPLGAGVPR